eukprot:9373645-Pyramimonas_sp.AAC.1
MSAAFDMGGEDMLSGDGNGDQQCDEATDHMCATGCGEPRVTNSSMCRVHKNTADNVTNDTKRRAGGPGP